MEKRPRVKKAAVLPSGNDRKEKPWLLKQKLLCKERICFVHIVLSEGKDLNIFLGHREIGRGEGERPGERMNGEKRSGTQMERLLIMNRGFSWVRKV